MTHKTGPIAPRIQIGLGFDHGVVQTALGSRNHKKTNEDSYWPDALRQPPHSAFDYLIAGRLYIVADGVSGGLAGHEASQLAVRTIAESYYASLFQLARPLMQNDIEHALKEAISEANRVLLRRSQELMAQNRLSDRDHHDDHHDHQSLQAAVICVLLRGQTATVANVGDCHLYRYRSDEVQLLSQPDHSTNYFVGANLPRDQISIYQKRLAAQDILILCSDGLYGYLAADNDAQKAPAAMLKLFERYYDSGGIKRVARQLLEEADNAQYGGGRDNITLMLIKPPSSLELFMAGETLNELIKGAWGLTEGLTDAVNAASHPIMRRLGEMAQQLANESRAPERALWQRRAAQLGISTGEAEWQKAQALSYELGLDFEENYSTVKQIWACYDEAPTHPQLAKLAFDAVVDLANTAILSAEPQKEAMLSQAFNLLSPLRQTLFKQIKQIKQIDQADVAYGEEVLLQLEQELTKVKANVTMSKRQTSPFRSQRLVWLMMGSALILLCAWIVIFA